ncbi:hypothetical protein [Brevibacillus porteri]|uniref:Holin n=2 Tax=Brevibacillus TaxID=55080 RepID=A0ABX5FHQ9_9BACL|nr:hypothetical protein [Brevibacillus porteri]MED1801765.1 hypothetical protein [Brevibacillus porteri]MED2134896.1 hypothetical protein [Brevibacillus porteri]MED2748403.1 hypothetical protein [Brevibacillus porteri]MED2818327.1 hypothetical protein [Brevibacillus porteri]MED2897714.1 hypothetical protein [Brevibacillus porteri]
MNEEFKRKLSSRKLWMAVAAFITSVLVLFGMDGDTITKVTAMITALGSVVAYMVAEGYVDAAHNKNDTSDQPGPTEKRQ